MCNNLAAFSCVIILGIPPFLLLSSPFYSLSLTLSLYLSLFHSLFLSITSTHTYDQICANVYYLSFFLSFSLIVCLSLYLSIAIFCPVYQIADLQGIEVEICYLLPFTLSLYASPFLSLSLSLYPFHLSLSLSLLSLPPLYISSTTFLSPSLSPSLSLLSIILFGVSIGRFRPCFLVKFLEFYKQFWDLLENVLVKINVNMFCIPWLEHQINFMIIFYQTA